MADIDPICELIDDAVDKHQALEAMPDVITWHGSGDAMVWSVEPPSDEQWTDADGTTHTVAYHRAHLTSRVEPNADSHGRVPYARLTSDEQETLHNWCRLHGIDHTRVPIDANVERDGDEWRVGVYRQREGKLFLGPDGEVATAVIRRAFKAELPWRKP